MHARTDGQILTHPVQFNQLKDINEIEPLSAGDMQCMRDLREVLRRYGALDRFGVHLLHKHFDLEEDEVLVEFVDEENRVLTTKPVRLDTLVGESIETQWRLSDGAAVTICNTRCFPGSPQAPGHIPRHVGY